MVDRNPKAPLSRNELNALRALDPDIQRPISDREERLFLAMGLAVKDGRAIRLSSAGRARLEQENRANR